MIHLNILDYSPVDEEKSPGDALWETTRLAQKAEKLGYKRFWVPEHHENHSLAVSSPEMVMMQLAANTDTIRIGSGGVMLPHYSPYKVAENFKTLEALYPNRIDLGIGRAPGGNRLATIALNEEKTNPIPFNRQVEDLVGFLDFDQETRFEGLTATPEIDTKPEIWMLGSGGGSAQLAGESGVSFTFAHFINPFGDGIAALANYKKHFKPLYSQEPKTMVGVFVVAADTNEEAEELAKAFDVWLLRAESFNPPVFYPSIETARNYAQMNIYDQERVRQNRHRVIVGDAQKVKSEIERLAETYNTDEITILPNITGADHRQRAIQLISEAFYK